MLISVNAKNLTNFNTWFDKAGEIAKLARNRDLSTQKRHLQEPTAKDMLTVDILNVSLKIRNKHSFYSAFLFSKAQKL